MGLLDELFVCDDATQAAHRKLNANSIGESVARHLHGIAPAVDQTKIAGAIEGGLGNVALGMDCLAGGITDLAESLGHGLGAVNTSIESLGSGIDFLHADFNIAFGDLIWQSQQQTQALSSIIDALSAPVGTEAYEYRLRGEDSYKNGWYEEALSDLQKSADLNFRDFSVHRTIGNIFFYHCAPPRFEEAIEAYKKAAKYSRPRDAKQAAEAYLFAAFACAALREWQAVVDHCKESTALNPALLEAHYTCAQAQAQLGDFSGCWQRLAASISGDPRYFLQAEKDSLFTPFRSEIDGRLDTERSRVIMALDDYSKEVEELATSTSILTTSEAKQIHNLADVLSSARSMNVYPTLAHAVELAEDQYTPMANELKAMATRKAQLHQEATDALFELREAVYDGPMYVIEVVRPQIDVILQQATDLCNERTLVGYEQTKQLVTRAWVTAKSVTENRYRNMLNESAKGQSFECVLQKRADYDRRMEKKRAQELYDNREIWRADGRCLDCGQKVGFVDRLKGQKKCPKHR
ncbi:MAG: hypothetical protein ACYC64_14625 [Armatimonadota bacterium]